MTNRFAIAAAVATVLAVSACGSTQWLTTSGQSSASGAGGTSGTSGGDSELRVEAVEAGNPGEPGLPRGSGASIDDVLRLGAVATWVDAPDRFAISLPASDECWPTAGEPTLISPEQISVTFAAEAACEAQDAARTYTLDVPAGADARDGLEVLVEGLPHHFTLTLPAS